MAKSFFEVFPQVKLNREIAGMLDETVISRVSTTSRKDFLRIYLSSGRLLSKDRIYLLERELKPGAGAETAALSPPQPDHQDY